MTIDPKTVHEIARMHVQPAQGDVAATILRYFEPKAPGYEEFGAWVEAVYKAIRTAKLSWPDEQPQDEQDGEDGSALARILATLERHAARGSSGGEYDDADIRSILKGRMIWKTAAENASAEREPPHDEYGIRVDYVSTLTEVGAIAETLGAALETLEQFDAQQRTDVVSRTLMQRQVGDWHEMGDERG